MLTIGPTTLPCFRLPRAAASAAATAALLTTLAACAGDARTSGSEQAVATPPPARYRFSIVNTYPHDPEAFTQGLIYRDGFLYESTGLRGASSLRKVRLETGEVVQRIDLDSRYFGEGLTDWGDRLVQLTWQSNLGFVYDLASFDRLRTFSYPGEGWGITHDGRRLIMSDGTSVLRFLDPETFAEVGRLAVRERGLSVPNLNELEMVDGELFANVWQTDEIVIIDPQSGIVTARIDFSPLRRELGTDRVDVFNGIAWDREGRRLFVTGKYWPRLFEVEVHRD